MNRCRLLRAVALALATVSCQFALAQTTSLDVDVAASGSFQRAFSWSIDKTVTPASSDRFIGESQQLDYVLTLTKGEAQDSAFAVSGNAIISNPAGDSATITSITINYGANVIAHTCATGPLAGGASLGCPIDFTTSSSASMPLSIQVTTSGAIGGGSDSAEVVFAPPVASNDSVTVSDTNLSAGLTFSASGTHPYSQSASCVDSNTVTIENTATIDQTGASDTTRARVACHALRLERAVRTAPGRHWTWDIEKTHAETEPLQLSSGQTYNVVYSITATASASSDNAYTGDVTVLNTHPVSDALLLSVAAAIDGIDASVSCPSLIVPHATSAPDGSAVPGALVCPFSVTLPPGHEPTTLAVQVTQQLYAYSSAGVPTAAGTRLYSGSVAATPGSGGGESDECITLEDEYLGVVHALGEFCASTGVTSVTRSFTGPIRIAPESACAFDVPNLARLRTGDTGTQHEDSTLIRVERTDCLAGCTLTPGYWKTHSSYGPAPYDATWAAIGEDSPFFLATKDGKALSWYQVLWTAPKGNAYFILAHQYIAAWLNIEAGADASEQVIDAMAAAQELFETHTVAQIGALRGNKAPRPRFIELAGVLDMFNNGVGDLGANHCSEDETSAD